MQILYGRGVQPVQHNKCYIGVFFFLSGDVLIQLIARIYCQFYYRPQPTSICAFKITYYYTSQYYNRQRKVIAVYKCVDTSYLRLLSTMSSFISFDRPGAGQTLWDKENICPLVTLRGLEDISDEPPRTDVSRSLQTFVKQNSQENTYIRCRFRQKLKCLYFQIKENYAQTRDAILIHDTRRDKQTDRQTDLLSVASHICL